MLSNVHKSSERSNEVQFCKCSFRVVDGTLSRDACETLRDRDKMQKPNFFKDRAVVVAFNLLVINKSEKLSSDKSNSDFINF